MRIPSPSLVLGLPAGVVALAGLVGCYDIPPDLEFIDEVPIVASDRCSAAREAVVACVIDGDTFDIGTCGDGGERIRMLGIDAPETAKPDAPAECYADQATEELRRKIEGRTVFLTFDSNCTGVFGRTLAYTWLSSRSEEEDFIDITFYRFINQEMILEGNVDIFDEEFGDLIYRTEFEEALNLAQALGIGLWGTCESAGTN